MKSFYSGRIGRLHYFLILLLSALGYYLLGLDTQHFTGLRLIEAVVFSAFILIFILPLHVRRLHDLNFTGWFVLLIAIPFLNIGVMLFLLLMPGTKGRNSYDQVRKRNILDDFLNK